MVAPHTATPMTPDLGGATRVACGMCGCSQHIRMPGSNGPGPAKPHVCGGCAWAHGASGGVPHGSSGGPLHKLVWRLALWLVRWLANCAAPSFGRACWLASAGRPVFGWPPLVLNWPPVSTVWCCPIGSQHRRACLRVTARHGGPSMFTEVRFRVGGDAAALVDANACVLSPCQPSLLKRSVCVTQNTVGARRGAVCLNSFV